MRKIYLLALVALSSWAYAQSPNILQGPAVTNKATPGAPADRTPASPVKQSAGSSSLGKTARVTRVGTSRNDQQTNASIYRRIQLHTGGKISVTWTTSTDDA